MFTNKLVQNLWNLASSHHIYSKASSDYSLQNNYQQVTSHLYHHTRSDYSGCGHLLEIFYEEVGRSQHYGLKHYWTASKERQLCVHDEVRISILTGQQLGMFFLLRKTGVKPLQKQVMLGYHLVLRKHSSSDRPRGRERRKQ